MKYFTLPDLHPSFYTLSVVRAYAHNYNAASHCKREGSEGANEVLNNTVLFN